MVSYVIITMNRRQSVLDCLARIQEQVVPARKEIILVDNGSTDGTATAVRSSFGDVILIASPKNLGVAGARNLGFRAARGDFVIFVDDDAQFKDEDATLRAVGMFRSDPSLAVLSFAIFDPTTGKPERAAIPRSDKRFQTSTAEAAYFCGCGFAVRRSAMPETGPFWDQLFYSCEELDCSYYLVAQGLKIVSTSDIVIYHWKVPTARPSGQFIYYNARNRFLVALKWLPLSAVLTTALFWWVYLGWLAVRRWKFPFLWRGIGDGLRMVPAVLKIRSPLLAGDIRKIRSLSGRVWY